MHHRNVRHRVLTGFFYHHYYLTFDRAKLWCSTMFMCIKIHMHILYIFTTNQHRTLLDSEIAPGGTVFPSSLVSWVGRGREKPSRRYQSWCSHNLDSSLFLGSQIHLDTSYNAQTVDRQKVDGYGTTLTNKGCAQSYQWQLDESEQTALRLRTSPASTYMWPGGLWPHRGERHMRQ